MSRRSLPSRVIHAAASPLETAGKSAAPSPTSLYDAPPQRRATQALSWTFSDRPAAGSSLTISRSLRADIVIDPPAGTLAGTETLAPPRDPSRSAAAYRHRS